MLTFGYSCISAIFILDPMLKEDNSTATLDYIQTATNLGVNQHVDGGGGRILMVSQDVKSGPVPGIMEPKLGYEVMTSP